MYNGRKLNVWCLRRHSYSKVGINSGPGDQGPRTTGPAGVQLFLEVYIYTSQLVLGTSASSLASNPLFAHHDASHNVYQLEILSASEKSECICRRLIWQAMSIQVYYFTSLQKLWISNSRYNSKFMFVWIVKKICTTVCHSDIQAVSLPVLFNFCNEVK